MDILTPELLGGAAVVAAFAAWGAMRAWRSRRRLPLLQRREAPSPVGVAPEAPVRGIRSALAATGRRFRERLDAAVGHGDDVLFSAAEEALIAADVGAHTARLLIDRARGRVHHAVDPAALRRALREVLLDMLPAAGPLGPTQVPWVVLVTGVNGVGKTTTIGKLAGLHGEQGRKVLVVAADTFRAAAIDQLAVWAERTGAGLIRHGQGADPSAVVFDAMRAASARGVDVVLVDTAGRLHTRTPLMGELGKVRRTVEREIPGAPHEVLLVLDATTGQNALNQARAFVEAVGVTGLVVTKLDGTAKGGMVVALAQELGLPVRYVGVGEAVEDLRRFDPSEFVAGLLGAD